MIEVIFLSKIKIVEKKTFFNLLQNYEQVEKILKIYSKNLVLQKYNFLLKV